jgi:hypothetical protein
LKVTIISRLIVSERNILRKVYGPTYKNGVWLIKSNQELDRTIKHNSIINFAKTQKLGWYGHLERMQETRMVKANTLLETHINNANGKT